MIEYNNAQNKKISRGREERISETEREGLEYFSCDRRVNGFEPVGTCDTDSTRPSFYWESANVRNSSLGKILERLEVFKTKYLKYVDSHQSRLRAQLEESKQGEEEFLEEYDQIKSDIYHLAIAQQKADENGHTN